MNECPTEYCPAVVAAADAADAVPKPARAWARESAAAKDAKAAAAKDAKAAKALEKSIAKGAANAAKAMSMSSQWAAAAKDDVVAEHKEAVAVAKAVPVETGEEITVEQLMAELVTPAPAPVADNAINWEAKYSSLRIKYEELKAKHVELLGSAVTMPVKAEKKVGQSCRFGERTFRAQPCFKTIKTSDKVFYPGQIVYGMATQQKGPVKKCDWKFKIVAITSKKLRGGDDYYHDITQVEDMLTGTIYPTSGATMDMITESYGPSSQHVYLMTELTE